MLEVFVRALKLWSTNKKVVPGANKVSEEKTDLCEQFAPKVPGVTDTVLHDCSQVFPVQPAEHLHWPVT